MTKLFSVIPLNGGRFCKITKEGAFEKNESPNNKVKHILDDCSYIFKKYPETILLGHLFSDKPSVQTLLGKKSTTKKDLEKICSSVQFYVYDSYEIGKEFLNYSKRHYWKTKVLIDNRFRKDDEYVSNLKTLSRVIPFTNDDIRKEHSINLKQGYVGSMVIDDFKEIDKDHKNYFKILKN